MTIELLISALVRQTTILIAQLATLGGGRAPLAQVADQVFIELVQELERQGVSRKVSADMFGLGLRTYRRKIQRLRESVTERGRSLWEVVLEFVKKNEGVTRNDVFVRFSRDDEAQLRSVLRDLVESGLLLMVGKGQKARYRAASDEELLESKSSQAGEGMDDLLMALMYREEPLYVEEIAKLGQVDVKRIEAPLARLVSQGRVQVDRTTEGPRYRTGGLIIPLGAAAGWEGAVFDHFKAMVATIMVKLRAGERANSDDLVGGSTYTMEVWPDHPLEHEVLGALSQFRKTMSDLRGRVANHNQTSKRPRHYSRVVVYGGQCVISEDET